ncbi:type I-MYXAN CRISPR-associated Cas8a1/Cmx1 [Cyanobacteria bacterium FACHB-63]|nr:type I-MYXAN CRISPR-associated Cas8a1/Cmx1 [Cyanobacteria bacterium FACHB-63]
MSVTHHKIQLNLNDRSMTWLHNAGLAGLWMTLKQLEKKFPASSQRPGQLDWVLSSHTIDLSWSGCDLDALDWLLGQSFRISHKGLISLPGLDEQTLSIDSQVAIHQGITGTFLQHNKFYKSDEEKSLNLKVGKKTVAVQYKGLTSYVHQEFARHLCGGQGQLLQKPLEIASWLYPGAVMSHAAFSKETKLEFTPNEALALLFAPVACWYFMLPIDVHNKQARFVLLIPEIFDLKEYAECDQKCRNLTYECFWAVSLGDAGLRFLALRDENQVTLNHDSRQCQALLFGKAQWASQQRVRTAVETVGATEEMLSCYRLSCKAFPRNILYDKDRKSYVLVSNIPGIIADNLVKGLPWWSRFKGSDNTKPFEGLGFEKEELLKMIEETQWNDPSKKLFILACHEALRRIYAKLYDRAADTEYVQIERRNIRIRSELGRCKNATTLRRFISDFFAEAGQIPTLQNHWEELLPITTGEVDWQLTRDLILLALASYKKDETSKKPENSQPEGLESLQTSEETV